MSVPNGGTHHERAAARELPQVRGRVPRSTGPGRLVDTGTMGHLGTHVRWQLVETFLIKVVACEERLTPPNQATRAADDGEGT